MRRRRSRSEAILSGEPVVLQDQPVDQAEAIVRATGKVLRDRELATMQGAYNKLLNGQPVPDGGVIPWEEECYDLAVAGRPAGEIANHLAVTRGDELGKILSADDVRTAIQRVSDRKKAALKTSLTDHFVLDLERVEKLIAAAWTRAMTGEPTAISAVVLLLRRKSALLGLDAPEVRMTLHAGVGTGPDLGVLSLEELQVYKNLLAKMEGSPTKDVTPKGPSVKTRAEAITDVEMVSASAKARPPRDPD